MIIGVQALHFAIHFIGKFLERFFKCSPFKLFIALIHKLFKLFIQCGIVRLFYGIGIDTHCLQLIFPFNFLFELQQFFIQCGIFKIGIIHLDVFKLYHFRIVYLMCLFNRLLRLFFDHRFFDHQIVFILNFGLKLWLFHLFGNSLGLRLIILLCHLLSEFTIFKFYVQTTVFIVFCHYFSQVFKLSTVCRAICFIFELFRFYLFRSLLLSGSCTGIII